MSNNFEVGKIVTGKVTAIKPFGAFVALDENTQGLVHISQVAHGFVKDINECLSVGGEVQVKILSIDENSGKISLSIRETLPAPEPTAERKERKERPRRPKQQKRGAANYQDPQSKEAFNPIGDKLQAWLNQNK